MNKLSRALGCGLLCAACSNHLSHDQVDASIGNAIDAAGDADLSGACVPTGSFAGEALPPAVSGSHYDAAAFHLGATAPQVLVAARSPSTSFRAAVVVWTKAASWQQSNIGGDAAWLSPGSLAATPDHALCVAYMFYDGSLHVACEGAADRAIAPHVTGAIALVRTGTTVGVVYSGQDNSTSGLLWQPFDGSSFDGNPGPAEVIDDRYATIGTSAVAVDANGDPHVVYEALPTSGPYSRLLYHAVRHAGVWTTELVDQDTAFDNGVPESNTIAFVIDGDQPAFVYGHHSTSSLRFARRTAQGTFDTRTLVATDPGFASDSVGRSVALQRDCGGRLLVVYQRAISTDAPNIQLAYARITDSGLADETFLSPPSGEDATGFDYVESLGFYGDATGHQYVVASMLYDSSPLLYLAAR